MIDKYETRKLHVSVPFELYNFLREKRLFKEIDGIIVKLLIEYYEVK